MGLRVVKDPKQLHASDDFEPVIVLAWPLRLRWSDENAGNWWYTVYRPACR
jgi:hypothetical protein